MSKESRSFDSRGKIFTAEGRSGSRGAELKNDYLHRPRSFFCVGRVLKVLWDSDRGCLSNDDFGRAWEMGLRGRKVVPEQMFVIAETSDVHSIGLMILTYDGMGAGADNVALDEHGIVYTGLSPPRPLWREVPSSPNERPMQSQPICVEMDEPSRKLSTASRINYGKACTIEHDVRVKAVGQVHPDSLQDMLTQWQSVNSKSSNDAESRVFEWKSGSEEADREKELGVEYREEHSDEHTICRDQFEVSTMLPATAEAENHTMLMASGSRHRAKNEGPNPLLGSFEKIQEISSMFEQVIAMNAHGIASGDFSASIAWQDELGRFRLFSSGWSESGPFLLFRAGDCNYDIFSDSILTELACVKEELVEVLGELREQRPEMENFLADASAPAEEALNRAGQIHEAVESLNRTLRDLHEQRSIQDRGRVTSDMIERRLALIDVLTGHIETTHANLKLSDSRALARLAVSSGEEVVVCPVCEEAPEEFGLASEIVTARDP